MDYIKDSIKDMWIIWYVNGIVNGIVNGMSLCLYVYISPCLCLRLYVYFSTCLSRVRGGMEGRGGIMLCYVILWYILAIMAIMTSISRGIYAY